MTRGGLKLLGMRRGSTRRGLWETRLDTELASSKKAEAEVTLPMICREHGERRGLPPGPAAEFFANHGKHIKLTGRHRGR